MNDPRRGMKLLIVDDEVKFLQSISKRLALKDIDVTTASTGKEAVEASNKGKFDVAILDLKMPDIDGTEMLKTLKARHKFLQIIMLTGHASIDSAVECTKLGAFDYLEKPYEFEKLLEILQKAYEARLRKKFERDQKRSEEINKLAMGASPLGILRGLAHIDDDEK